MWLDTGTDQTFFYKYNAGQKFTVVEQFGEWCIALAQVDIYDCFGNLFGFSEVTSLYPYDL